MLLQVAVDVGHDGLRQVQRSVHPAPLMDKAHRMVQMPRTQVTCVSSVQCSDFFLRRSGVKHFTGSLYSWNDPDLSAMRAQKCPKPNADLTNMTPTMTDKQQASEKFSFSPSFIFHLVQFSLAHFFLSSPPFFASTPVKADGKDAQTESFYTENGIQ